ncbi:MAG: hypothetical protein V7K48_32735 [Nostoc sp.]|uniref:hypothetical protein n=1 Tax=Nostoc sp. TaxID=1180 RepID=UPI002FF6435B
MATTGYLSLLDPAKLDKEGCHVGEGCQNCYIHNSRRGDVWRQADAASTHLILYYGRSHFW